MDQQFFSYRQNSLYVEGVSLQQLAFAFGTPAYVYSAACIREAWHKLSSALSGLDMAIHYAVKANSNLAILKILQKLGAGADVVSHGEILRARRASIPTSEIVFSGVGKTRHEIEEAISLEVGQLNVESSAELELINQIAGELNKTATIALRVNPDVDARTHHKITTGLEQNKFGIAYGDALSLYHMAHELPNVRPVGLAIHLGSQMSDVMPYQLAFERLAALTVDLRAEGYAVQNLDLGGGLGIAYPGQKRIDIDQYAQAIRDHIAPLGCHMIIEPGRYLVGMSGVLLSRVLYIKDSGARQFVIIDAGMNDLLRPSLYEAIHSIHPVIKKHDHQQNVVCDVVGPVCESGDSFGQNLHIPPLQAEDLVVLGESGAYGAVMSSFYNSRDLCPEILVDGEHYAVIRRRPPLSEILDWEDIPSWLS